MLLFNKLLGHKESAMSFSSSVPKISDNFAKQIDAFFETSLRRIGLTKDLIESQDAAQLYRSLSVVEDALTRAESFGVCRVKVSATMSVIVSTSSDAHFETGITPLLLEAKTHILSRLQELGANSQEEEKSIIRQQLVKYRNRWLLSLGSILWVVASYFIWRIPEWLNWALVMSHKSYLAISILLCIVLAGLLWAFLDTDKARRNFAFGSVVLAGILAGVALL